MQLTMCTVMLYNQDPADRQSPSPRARQLPLLGDNWTFNLCSGKLTAAD